MNNLKKQNGKELFGSITSEERMAAIESIIESSCPRRSFFVMIVAAAMICTVGVAADNAAVVIGAMLVAPMLSPILAIALGIVMADFKLIYRSFRVVLLALLYSFVASFLIALTLGPRGLEQNHEVLLRANVTLEALLVALIAGVAASLAIIKKELQSYLAGTVIAVALIPAISTSAIALSVFRLDIFYQSLMIFVFNLAGIILSSLLVFSLGRFYISRHKAEEELEEENRILREASRE